MKSLASSSAHILYSSRLPQRVQVGRAMYQVDATRLPHLPVSKVCSCVDGCRLINVKKSCHLQGQGTRGDEWTMPHPPSTSLSALHSRQRQRQIIPANKAALPFQALPLNLWERWPELKQSPKLQDPVRGALCTNHIPHPTWHRRLRHRRALRICSMDRSSTKRRMKIWKEAKTPP